MPAVIVLAGFGGACGGGDPDVDASDAGGTETAPAVSAPNVRAGTVDCSAFPEELIIEVALGYARVRQLTPENLEFMQESLGLPDPAAFRTFADAFEQLDISGIETMQFDTPDTTVVGQRQLADRIEAALAARDEPDNPPGLRSGRSWTRTSHDSSSPRTATWARPTASDRFRLASHRHVQRSGRAGIPQELVIESLCSSSRSSCR